MGGGGGDDDRRRQRRSSFHVRPDWLWSSFDSDWVGGGFCGLVAILLLGFGACAVLYPKGAPIWFAVYAAAVFAAAISFFVGYPIVSWLRALHTRHRAVCFLYEAARAAEPDQAVVDTHDADLLLVLLEWRFAMRLRFYQHLRPPTLLALCKALLLCPDVVDAVRFPRHRVDDDRTAPVTCVNVDSAPLVDRQSSVDDQITQLLACIRRAVLENPSRWRD